MNEMDRFEKQLREALQRTAPPAGLEQRILRSAAGRRRPAEHWWLRVAASVVVLVSAALFGMHWRGQQLRARKAEEARQQLELALKITSRTLAKTEARLQAIGVERIEVKEVSQ